MLITAAGGRAGQSDSSESYFVAAGHFSMEIMLQTISGFTGSKISRKVRGISMHVLNGNVQRFTFLAGIGNQSWWDISIWKRALRV